MCQIQSDENIQTLLEMFPNLQRAEAGNLLTIANGDLEKSVQMVLAQMESGDEDPTKNLRMIPVPNPPRARAGQVSF